MLNEKNIAIYHSGSSNKNIQFTYIDFNNTYLRRLRNIYQIDKMINSNMSEIECVLILSNWVHSLWVHEGTNIPSKYDPISIIEESKEGRGFRCTEYAFVLNGLINSLGIHSRIVNLMNKDIETLESGAGHNVVEFFAREQNKWIMADAAWDIITVKNDIPLSSLELYYAIIDDPRDIKFLSISNKNTDRYLEEIIKYLYYYSTYVDNRVGITITDGIQKQVMLVPMNAKNPRFFQRKHIIKNTIYTNSINDFYKSPIGEV